MNVQRPGLSERLQLFLFNLALYVRHPRQVLKFRIRVGFFPNMAAPASYSELMLWRKLFDHNPLFTVFCDKLAAKDYSRAIIPGMKIPETLWVGTDIADMPETFLRGKYVLKANHGCDFNYFLDGRDIAALKKLTRKWLATTYGTESRQWGYRGARKLLFVEEFIEPPPGQLLLDLAIRASDGEPLLASVVTHSKTDQARIGYFALDGARYRPAEAGRPLDSLLPPDFELPPTFRQAVEHTRQLSRGVDFARYDFLSCGNDLYAGEITVYPAAGLAKADRPQLEGIDVFLACNWNMRTTWFFNQKPGGWKKFYARPARRYFGLVEA